MKTQREEAEKQGRSKNILKLPLEKCESMENEGLERAE
jgi:hypothetical protein